MARWRQIWDEEQGKSHFIPIDDAAKQLDSSAAIHGPIEPFVSPIDGTVISGRKSYREHCERHGVVPSQEFSKDFYAEKAKERARLFTGEHTRAEQQARREEIHRIMDHIERR